MPLAFNSERHACAMSDMPTGNPLPPEGVNAPRGTGLGEFVRVIIGLIVLTVLVTGGLILGARWLAPLIPFHWERSVAQSFEPSEQVGNASADKALQQLASELIADANLPEGMTIDVHLVPNEVPNAFATLGGQVMINRGLLDHVDSENGLAMVLAHEIAHIRERHPIQAMSRGAVLALVFAVASGTTGEEAISSVLGQAGLMTALSFNRDMEREADSIALAILRRHYGHTRGAGEFFRSMQQEDSAPVWTTLLRTHPRSQERLEAMAQRRRVDDAERQPMPEALDSL